MTATTEAGALFRSRLEEVGGHVHVARDEDSAARALAAIAAEQGAKDVALSDSPLVARIAQGLDASTFDGSGDRERLLSCDLGVTSAQLGIADTGTLVLVSASERHRLVSLVPPIHVAVLHAADLVGNLGDALGAVVPAGGAPPPLVTFVTGPSRTADIELTLVVGVHGPRELHVILIESEPRP